MFFSNMSIKLAVLSSSLSAISLVTAGSDFFFAENCIPTGKVKGAAVRFKDLGQQEGSQNFYVGAGDVGQFGTQCRAQETINDYQIDDADGPGEPMPFSVTFTYNDDDNQVLAATIDNLVGASSSKALEANLHDFSGNLCGGRDSGVRFAVAPTEEWTHILFYLKNENFEPQTLDVFKQIEFRKLTIKKGSGDPVQIGTGTIDLSVQSGITTGRTIFERYAAIKLPPLYFVDSGESIVIEGELKTTGNVTDQSLIGKERGRFEILFVKLPEGICGPPPPCGTACGDPHFTTWHGEHYDYHGKCDLELLSDPTFDNGKGIRVHIRTEIVRQWSYIKTAAIQIGDDILEVMGGAAVQSYWFNKEYQAKLDTIGGLPIKYHKANSKAHVYEIDLGERKIEVRTYKDFVRIDFKDATMDVYGQSVGLLGDFATGKKLGRDGTTVFTDYIAFGQEWQVQPDAPHLFHEVEGPQAPHDKCIMPAELHAEEKRRRLGEKAVTKMEAEVACHVAGIAESQRDMCVQDVLAVDDLEMAGVYYEMDMVGAH